VTRCPTPSVHGSPTRLRKLGIPATFFVSSAFVDSSTPFPHDVRRGFHDIPSFTSAQLRDMASDPLFEIGSHSVSHIDFSARPPAETIERELVESRRALEAITGETCGASRCRSAAARTTRPS
jgi:peptidoglycan/xylan/chitin deacetylase (PgdA/CDA1 family)